MMIRQNRAYRVAGGSETSMREDYYTDASDSYADFESDGGTPQSAGGLSFVLRLLRGRWHWAVLLGLLLGAGGGYLGYYLQPPKYTAWSEIKIKPDYGIPIEVQDLSLYEPYWNVVQTEIDRLQDLATAELAMQQPDWQEVVGRTPGYTAMTPADFVDNIELNPPSRNKYDVEIQFVTDNPTISQAGLNALLDAYELLQKEEKSEEIDGGLKILQAQKRSLELLERQIREQIRQVIPDDEYQMVKRRLASKLAELANMEFKLSELDVLLGPAAEQTGQPIRLTAEEMMLQDPEMIALLDQRKTLEEDYKFQTGELGQGESHPNVRQVKRLLDRVNRQIFELEEIWRTRGEGAETPLPPQMVELNARHKVLTNKVETLKAEASDLALLISLVEKDEYRLEQTRQELFAVDDQIRAFRLTDTLKDENEKITRIEIGDRAGWSDAPSNTKKRIQFAGLGGVGGLGMGFGLVMLIGLMDRRLRHVSDTASDLPDVSVLGMLPSLPSDLKDLEQAEVAAHGVHHIRTLLQIGGSRRVFSITSPEAGSGKSSLATALGMSFAASGTRTLVIDADLVGAGLSRRLGSVVHESLDVVIRQKGLVDEAELARAASLAASHGESLETVLLREQLITQEQIETAKRLQLDTSLGLLDACVPGRLRSCVAPTEVERLFVLPVGKARPADASRLAPAAMRELVRQAREAFDIVLLDTGPVLGSLEASIAAAEADATIMIVSRGDHRSVATRSLEQLRSVRAEVAGLVFNHALEKDLMQNAYASLVSQDRRPDQKTRRRKLNKSHSARLGPLGTALAGCSDVMGEDAVDTLSLDGSFSSQD